jgi:hypothetical protein
VQTDGRTLEHLGKAIIIAGAILIVVGVALTFSDRVPFLGKLPGDIHIKRGNFQVYFPLMTSLVLSAALTLLIWIIRQLSRR